MERFAQRGAHSVHCGVELPPRQPISILANRINTDHCLSMLKSATGNEEARKLVFISHLRQIFPQERNTAFIDDLAGSAERYLKTVPSGLSSAKTGFADAAFGNVIIEFKSDLSSNQQRDTARTELRRYTAALWNERGADAVFCCIATDIQRWRVWRPVPIEKESFEGQYDAEKVALEEQDFFDAGPKPGSTQAEHLTSMLQRFLFENNARELSANALVTTLGPQSTIYQSAVPQLKRMIEGATRETEIQLAVNLWRKHLRFNAAPDADLDEELYASQLYLVLLSRLLVAAFHTKDQGVRIEDDTVQRILKGEFFVHTLRVRNFVEDDFFGWTRRNPWRKQIAPIARQLFHELRAFDFKHAKQTNVLRLLYREMMPARNREVLGQRSTPDALAVHIVDALSDDEDPTEAFLDPACGTGTFLRAVIARKRATLLESGDFDDRNLLDRLTTDTAAIDIDPVAVLITKAVWMIGVLDLLPSAARPVSIPVYHADAFFLPNRETAGADEARSKIVFDDEENAVSISIPDVILENASTFDTLVNWCYSKAQSVAENKKEAVFEGLDGPLPSATEVMNLEPGWSDDEDKDVQDALRALVEAFAQRIHENRNGIWAFVVRNSYRPSLLAGRFDVVASNPPWLTISSMRRIDVPYSENLWGASKRLGVLPTGASGHHLEVAVPFALHTAQHYLRPGGRAAFVLPRSLFDGNQHHAFRQLDFQEKVAFEIEEIWDLGAVDNLFEIKSCVLLGRKDDAPA